MKTTIVVEDGGVPTRSSVSDTPAAAQSGPQAPVDAGAAPVGDAGGLGAPASSNGASDGGEPPSWLLDAIAQAGGSTAPSSLEDVEDAGAAPA